MSAGTTTNQDKPNDGGKAMSKTGASPEFERKLQEIGAKFAHAVIPRDDTHRPITEPRYPAWVEESEPTTQVIPAEAVEALAHILARDALFDADVAGAGWDAENDSADHFMPRARERARTYLEAAAPHINARTIAYLDEAERMISSDPEVKDYERGFDDAVRGIAAKVKRLLNGEAQ